MKRNLTELVFILDRSGSMSGLEGDTIGGYRSLIEKQKAEEGDALVTTVLFDDRYELLHDRISLKGIVPMTDKDYYVRGSTALIDAIGRTLDKIGNAQAHTAESERPQKTVFVIITDGEENASREYGLQSVKEQIERRKERDGWEFLFLGANIDAISAAGSFGIDADRAVRYNSDHIGTKLNYSAVSSAVGCMRANMPVTSEWKKEIDEDFKKRKVN